MNNATAWIAASDGAGSGSGVLLLTGLVSGGLLGAAAGSVGRGLLVGLRRGVRPPGLWCEGAVAVLWSMVLTRAVVGALPWWWVPVPLGLAWLAVLLTACDVVAGRLPDALTLPAYPVAAALLGAAALWGRTPGLLLGAVVGTAVYAGTYLLVRMISARSMGPGDVKLAGTLGAVVGAVSLPAVVSSMVAAAALTLVLVVFALARQRGGDGIPHGPAMLAPAWLVTAFPAVTVWIGGVW